MLASFSPLYLAQRRSRCLLGGAFGGEEIKNNVTYRELCKSLSYYNLKLLSSHLDATESAVRLGLLYVYVGIY